MWPFTWQQALGCCMHAPTLIAFPNLLKFSRHTVDESKQTVMASAMPHDARVAIIGGGIAGAGLQVWDCRCGIAGVGLQVQDCSVGLQVWDCRCGIAGVGWLHLT